MDRRGVRRRGRGWLGLCGDKAQGGERDQLWEPGSRGEGDGGGGGEGLGGADVCAEGERGAPQQGVGRGKPSVGDGSAGGHVGWRRSKGGRGDQMDGK